MLADDGRFEVLELHLEGGDFLYVRPRTGPRRGADDAGNEPFLVVAVVVGGSGWRRRRRRRGDAVGLVLRFVAGLGASESVGIAAVALTLVDIFVATIGAAYTVETARAARDTVGPLQRTADTLTSLAKREEAVVAALDRLLEESRLESRRRLLLSQLELLLQIVEYVDLIARAQNRVLAADAGVEFPALQAHLRSMVAWFPRGVLPEGIAELAGMHSSAFASAPTGQARLDVENEIQRVHDALATLNGKTPS